MSEKDFDLEIRSRLENYSSEVSEDMWDRIRSGKKRKRGWFFLGGFMILFLLITLIGSGHLFKTFLSGTGEKNSENTIKQKNQDRSDKNNLSPNTKESRYWNSDSSENGKKRSEPGKEFIDPKKEAGIDKSNHNEGSLGQASNKGQSLIGFQNKKESKKSYSNKIVFRDNNPHTNRDYHRTLTIPFSLKPDQEGRAMVNIKASRPLELTGLLMQNAGDSLLESWVGHKIPDGLNQVFRLEKPVFPRNEDSGRKYGTVKIQNKLHWAVEGFYGLDLIERNRFPGFSEQAYPPKTPMGAGFLLSGRYLQHFIFKTGFQYLFSGNGIQDYIDSNSYLHKIHYHSVEWPLLLGYQGGGNNIKWDAWAGPVLDLFAQSNPAYLDSLNTRFYRSFGMWSVMAGGDVFLYLNKSLDFFADPYFRIGLSNLINTGHLYTEKIELAGIRLGIRYRFAKN